MIKVYDNLKMNRSGVEGTAEAVKAYIDETVAKARAMGMIGEGVIELSLSCWGGDGCGGEIEIDYYFDRTETNDEKEKREKAEAKKKEAEAAKRKAAAEARKLKNDAEYAEYVRLKNKFKGV